MFSVSVSFIYDLSLLKLYLIAIMFHSQIMPIWIVYSDWFPGWQGNEHSNKQPSDDGFSDEDCVEVRRTFHNLYKGTSEAEHFFWNDRKCSTRNPYICQINKFDGMFLYDFLSDMDCFYWSTMIRNLFS